MENKKETLLKGTVYLVTAQAIFLLSGYIINFGLAKMLSTTGFGVYSIVTTLFVNFNVILSTGVPLAISKYIAVSEHNKQHVLWAGLKLQTIIGISLGLLILILAYPIAIAFNDVSLFPYFILGSILFPFYSIYLTLYGSLNGMQRYNRQAFVQILYSLGKITLIFLLAIVLPESAFGAVLGFSLAPIVGVIAGIIFTGIKKSTVEDNLKKIFLFMVPVSIFNMIATVNTSLDLYEIKLLFPDEVANYYSGIYSAAMVIGKIPALIAITISTVVFPKYNELSKTEIKLSERKRITEIAMFIILLLCFPLISIVFHYNHVFIPLFYNEDYLMGSVPMVILMISMLIMGIFYFYSYIAISHEKAKYPLISVLITLITEIVIFPILIKKYQMIGAAIGSLIASTISLSLLLTIFLIRGLPLYFSGKKTFIAIALNSLLFILLFFVQKNNFIISILGITAFCIIYGLIVLLIILRSKYRARLIAIITFYKKN